MKLVSFRTIRHVCENKRKKNWKLRSVLRKLSSLTFSLKFVSFTKINKTLSLTIKNAFILKEETEDLMISSKIHVTILRKYFHYIYRHYEQSYLNFNVLCMVLI